MSYAPPSGNAIVLALARGYSPPLGDMVPLRLGDSGPSFSMAGRASSTIVWAGPQEAKLRAESASRGVFIPRDQYAALNSAGQARAAFDNPDRAFAIDLGASTIFVGARAAEGKYAVAGASGFLALRHTRWDSVGVSWAAFIGDHLSRSRFKSSAKAQASIKVKVVKAAALSGGSSATASFHGVGLLAVRLLVKGEAAGGMQGLSISGGGWRAAAKAEASCTAQRVALSRATLGPAASAAFVSFNPPPRAPEGAPLYCNIKPEVVHAVA